METNARNSQRKLSSEAGGRQKAALGAIEIRCIIQLRVASELAREDNESFNKNITRLTFREIKCLSSVSDPGVSILLKTDGGIVVDREGCRRRLVEYFVIALQCSSPSRMIS